MAKLTAAAPMKPVCNTSFRGPDTTTLDFVSLFLRHALVDQHIMRFSCTLVVVKVNPDTPVYSS